MASDPSHTFRPIVSREVLREGYTGYCSLGSRDLIRLPRRAEDFWSRPYLVLRLCLTQGLLGLSMIAKRVRAGAGIGFRLPGEKMALAAPSLVRQPLEATALGAWVPSPRHNRQTRTPLPGGSQEPGAHSWARADAVSRRLHPLLGPNH